MSVALQPWPAVALDPASLRAAGWRPAPLTQFVFKVHQRCNLACDYCYVYTMADQSWRSRPKVMSEKIWTAAADRIGRHASTHGLTKVAVVLHGGEPLLAGPTRLGAIVRAVRSAVPAGTTVKVGVQTNGVLITERMLDCLMEHEVHVGVSLDGTAEHNDAHRHTANGKGSFARVERGLRLLNKEPYRSIYSGLLCTIDPDTDPVATYETLLEFDPPAIDVLMPHAGWNDANGVKTDTRVGDWLVALFDRWAGARKLETQVRLFDSVLRLMLGRDSRSDFVGLSPSVVAVVESDGAIEQDDILKSVYARAADTGLSVLTDDFDAMLTHPGVVSRQIGIRALCDTCVNCDLVKLCGGGHYAHRYRPESGFVNPSAYCADLSKFILHVRDRVMTDLAPGTFR